MIKDMYKPFSEANTGDTLSRPVLVSNIEEGTSRTGSSFVRISLKDGFSEITAMLFDSSSSVLESKGIVKDCVADVSLYVSDYQGAKSFKVNDIKPTTRTELSINDFIKMPPVDIDLMYNEICDLLRSSRNDYSGKYTPLADLALQILEENKNSYMTSSAAVSMHHNLRGGLLYHSYRMVKSADALCSVYSSLDRELLLCGTALHDIGKIWEYKTSPTGDAEFTASGVLFGHLYMGASLIKGKTTDGNYNMEKVQLLIHMILSHHGTQEWGAVACPSIPEAFALHYIDNIDAKIYMCEDFYENMESGSLTEKRPFGLDNRIYKPNFEK